MGEPEARQLRPRVRPVGLTIGLLLFALVALVPSPLHDIPGQGHRPAYAAAVAILMAAWWFTDALPMGWTACLPLLLYPLLDVFGDGFGGSLVQSAERYADAYIFLFLGGMLLGAAMEQWGLHRRIALHIMVALGTTPRRLLLGMLVATALVSMWISNTATAVMMLPIAMALIRQLEHGEGGRRLEHFGGAVMLAVAYAANVGGIGTKIGTGTNSIFLGFASEELGVELSFLRYFALAAPFVLLMIPLIWGVLWGLARHDRMTSTQGREVLRQELRGLGPLRGRERWVAFVFLGAATLWILGDPLKTAFGPTVGRWIGAKIAGKHVEATIAMGAAFVLLALRTLRWESIRKVPWDTLLLLGGSFAMAAGIEGSGLSTWVAEQLAGVSAMPLWAQLAIASSATIALSAVATNTATINVMLNVLPRSLPVLLAATFGASCDFALPAGTPPNAIVFGSGYVRLRVMMRLGAVLDLAAAIVITAYALLWMPLLLP